jgi:hypothetical protein
MHHIKELISSDKFKFRHMDTLFDMDILAALKLGRCPYDGCKLYLMRNQPRYYCKSNKHIKPFTIAQSKLEEILKYGLKKGVAVDPLSYPQPPTCMPEALCYTVCSEGDIESFIPNY